MLQVNSVLNAIRRRKSRDTVIVAGVASICSILILLYWLSKWYGQHLKSKLSNWGPSFIEVYHHLVLNWESDHNRWFHDLQLMVVSALSVLAGWTSLDLRQFTKGQKVFRYYTFILYAGIVGIRLVKKLTPIEVHPLQTVHSHRGLISILLW